ncbi:hypothetical protein LC603019_00708 [Lawsonella clevelandensis]|uniref:Uncharacterized protein n=1 Tax=Lawsonella clevelandensis TaxID=1528099 RepID=A0A5E3ZWX2_9ACTN|nr:hypothetical protein LC603019_00708 [Lawsonella clevelandensis]
MKSTFATSGNEKCNRWLRMFKVYVVECNWAPQENRDVRASQYRDRSAPIPTHEEGRLS